MASIADLISNLKKKLTGGYNTVADALPIVPNTSQIKSFTANPVQFMSNPSYNGGNNLFSTTPFRVSSQIQKVIESPKSTADMVPRFQAPENASLLRKSTNFLYNIPIEMGASIVGRGIVDPILDASQNIGRTIGGRPLAGYEQVKSPVTRAGYQIAGGMIKLKAPTDTKYNAKEVLGNIGGVANPIIDASTGSLAKKLATNVIRAGGKETAKILLKRGITEGGLMGGASGLSLGLSDNRKTASNLDYVKNTLTSLATGATMGAVIGGASSGAGIVWNKLLRDVRRIKPRASEQEVISTARKFVRDEMGRFTGRIKNETEWIKDPYIADSQRKALRRSWMLPEDGNYEGGFAKLDEPIVGTGKSQGLPKSTVDPIDTVNPTGGVFTKYDPQLRVTAPLAENITTLDKTSAKSADELVTIYRGAPISQKKINQGDFVTTNQQLAKDYAGTGKVISQKVRLGDLLDDINEPLGEEYIYRPQSTPTRRIQEQKVKFSPTEMTREEMIARDMLKKKTITPQQYNEIAVKNEGKIKPIQQDPNKLYQQAKMIENMARDDRNMAKADAQAIQDTTLDLTVNDRQKLTRLGKMIRKSEDNGMWDVETLRKENKGLVNWATERWREINYGTKDGLTDDELIQEIAEFTQRPLTQKVKVDTPQTEIIRQGLLKEYKDTVPNIEDQFPVKKGASVDADFAERQAKLHEQSLEQTYGARNATNDELEALMSTPDNELKGGYKVDKSEKVMLTLKGKGDEPKTFRDIVNKYLGGKKNISLTQYEQVKPISNVKFSDDGAKAAIKSTESGNMGDLPKEAQQYVTKLRNSFDQVRSEAVADGLPIGYVDNYLTHYWEQPLAQVTEVINRLKKSGSFEKNRTFLTYQEGIDAGLTPRFSNPTQILGAYVRQVENVRNNLRFIKSLEANGYVVSGKEREITQGVRQIVIPGFEGRFAKPEVASLIEGLFEPKEANRIIGTLGRISGKIQDITLSGGIPKTPFNAFSIAGNLQKQFLAGRFSGPLKSFARAFSPESTDRYFAENIPTIREIQGAGYSLPTTLSYKNLMGEGESTLKSKLGDVWNSAMSDPTFKRFIPMMQIDLYKEVKNTAMKSGLDEKQATEKAIQVLRNFEGMSDQYSQAVSDPNARAVTQTFLFAPKFRRAMIDFWVNSVKGLKNPLALENRYNTRFMAGAAVAFAGMNMANAALNNGKMMWENPSGKEDKLMIPDGKGGAVAVPFLSSIGTIPRGLYRQGLRLVKGDVSGSIKDAGQTYLSSGLKPLADVAANEDYFGKTIVQDDSKNKWLDIAKYLGKSYVSHPYLKELVDPANTSDPAYQRLSRAMELPFRFYDKKSLDASQYYSARDKALEGMSESERKAYDAIPKYDVNKPDNQIYKYQTFLTYPNVFEAKRMTEFELAKQTGKAIDPLYLVNYDTAKTYMRYETLPPGSQERKDLIKAKPELGALFDVRSKFFDENPIEGKTVATSTRPTPSTYVQAQMDAKNWSDPDVRTYLDANKQYQNAQREKLGLTPLAGFTPYEKKIKVAAMKKIKTPKIKLAKVKNVKFKIPKLKLARAKTIKFKSLKRKSLVKLKA